MTKQRFVPLYLWIQGGVCLLCGCRHQLTKHHVVPVEHGGDGSDWNMVGLCRNCHRSVHGHARGRIKFCVSMGLSHRTHSMAMRVLVFRALRRIVEQPEQFIPLLRRC